MNLSFRIQQEFYFLLKSKAILGALLLLLLVSAVSVGLGLNYVAKERQEIAQLIELDAEERAYKRSLAYDWGGAAYDAFHAVWNEPSDLTFAAIGQRDLNASMMRIRALAIEGQIYETDSVNPELALAGRFDFAFVAAYLLPLVILFVFYDLLAAERESGRFNLLTVTSRDWRSLWSPRVLLRFIGILLAVLLPLWIGMLVEGTELQTAMAATFAVFLLVTFWSVLALVIASRQTLNSQTLASVSICVWVLLVLAIPIAGKVVIESSVMGIRGADVSLAQREAVNDAWDLPKSATMEPFYESHPQWSDSAPLAAGFHWKWYYAFQQVGDETAAELAREYREMLIARDDLTAQVAWLSPAVAIQRRLESLASTNLDAQLAYEEKIRQYHEQIRRAYYPALFRDIPFSKERLKELSIPDFSEL